MAKIKIAFSLSAGKQKSGHWLACKGPQKPANDFFRDSFRLLPRDMFIDNAGIMPFN